MFDQVIARFRNVAPRAEFWSLRMVSSRQEYIQVRQNVLQPVTTARDIGVMITVIHRGGFGYAATSNLTESGLKAAASQAWAWAERSREIGILDFSTVTMPAPKGEYCSPIRIPWQSVPLPEKIDRAVSECARLKTDDHIVDWETSLWFTEEDHLFLTSTGGESLQHFELLTPGMSVTANEGSETVSRNFGGFDLGRQGGWEVLEEVAFADQPPVLTEEVIELLAAPNCPTGSMNLLLDASQMYLQVHESIGHPLELDRILGDERNYAGTSFVTPEMLGTYRYGSDLLNITFDPTIRDEFASYAYDDDGSKAEKEYIIRNGILERGLGGITSQARLGLPGVANSRACCWNRPPIDRMANLNLEPGVSSFEDMVAAVEQGVYMKSNNSWSIDDSRNKFQFGCEYGRVIRDGQWAEVVKKPNYKGISATFWRNLEMTGNQNTFFVMGTPHCGKGEPNQAIRVGHATPACLFSNVDVFGGE